MLAKLLIAAFFAATTVTSALATTFTFTLGSGQPALQTGSAALKDYAELSFEMLGGTLTSASYSIYGYTGNQHSSSIGSWATHVRGGSYQGINVGFVIDPNTPAWVCNPYPYCGTVDSPPIDGMPLSLDLNSISFKIVGDNNVSWPFPTAVTDQSLLDWIGLQANPMRIAIDYTFVSLGQSRTYLGAFAPVISSSIRDGSSGEGSGEGGVGVVPLPGSALLFLSGLGVLSLTRRRQPA